MPRAHFLFGLLIAAPLASAGCASAETECGTPLGCNAAGSGGAGGSGAAGGSGGAGGTAGAGGACGAVPAAIPVDDLFEEPPVTGPTWSGELSWVAPDPAPSGGYEVEVYSAGCSSELLPGFPAAVTSGSAYAWAPPGPGAYKWHVRALGDKGCPPGPWSDLRSLVVPGAEIPACSPTAPDDTFGTSGGKIAFYLPGCTYDSVPNDVSLDPTSATGEFYTAGRFYNDITRRGYVMKHDATGALVSGWGNGGVVNLGTEATTNHVHTLIVDCFGTIHIGSKDQFKMRLLRLTKDGAVDSTFGGGTGEVTENDLIDASVGDISLMDLDNQGRYVQSGTKWTGADGVAVLSRYRYDGALDPTFGTAGRTVLDLDTTAQDAGGPVKVQPDGKVVMAGYTAAAYPSITTTTASDLAVARVTNSGELDTTFGIGGITRIDISGTAELPTHIDIQHDGKILITAVTNHTSSYMTPSQWLIVRLTTEGALDPTFGSGGIVILDPPFGGANDVNDWPLDIAVRPDGTFWVAGQWGWNSGAGRAVLARLTEKGELDTCFGTGGWYSVSSWPQGFSQSDSFNGMAQQPDGALLLVAGINPSATGYAGVMRFKD